MGSEKNTALQIGLFKHRPPPIDVIEAVKTWDMLERAIREIYHRQGAGLRFEELYRGVYKMVLYEFGDILYTGLTVSIRRHLKEMLNSLADTHAGLFLEELDRKWENHTKALRMISNLFMYMNREYIPGARKAPVYDLGISLWIDEFIRPEKLQTRLQVAVFEVVQKESSGEIINRGSTRNVMKMLNALGSRFYKECFEKGLIKILIDFYRLKSQQLLAFCSCGQYLKTVETFLQEEIERLSYYLEFASLTVITAVLEKEMIGNHIQKLVNMESCGLINMIEENKCEDLERMYRLFSKVADAVPMIRSVMTSQIRKTGKQLVTNPEWSKDPVDSVKLLLDIREKYGKMISSAFCNDRTFLSALDSSFEYFINLNARTPEFISLFLDDKLRKGPQGVGEEDMEILLDKVMLLFHALTEKDIFEKYYKQHLAKRLLYGKSVSEEAERSLLVKLKTECGNHFTSKLECMFKDMEISKDITQKFHEIEDHETSEGLSLDVQVLTSGFWPSHPNGTCKLPAEVIGICSRFRDYYLGAHKGRKLSWQSNMGVAELRATFGDGQKRELIVSTYSMCVLMLFNDVDNLSYKEIEQATEIPSPDLKRCLQSLACVKGKNVLRKDPMSKEVLEDDNFSFNHNFSSRSYRVKIGTVAAQRETEPEKKETRERVEFDRKPQIEAAIMRVMKSRRVMDHNDIVAEVTKQLHSRFLPNPVIVKKRIENLIEREFLERDETDRKLYRYIA